MNKTLIMITSLLLTPYVWSMPLEIAEKITASDGAANNNFGYSVSISGDTALIGDNSLLGSAYVFVRTETGWIEQAKLTASDGTYGDNFGWSVAVDGDTAVIGAEGDDDRGSLSGSAYIFTRTGTTWTEQIKLVPGDLIENDLFGRSVSISGDTVIIGTYRGGFFSTLPGAAYIFTRSGTSWNQQSKLDAFGGDLFPHSAGSSVSISGETVVIGASQDSSVFVYLRSGSTWTEQAKISLTNEGDYFGGSVSIDGDTILVGANNDDDDGTSSGSSYIFARSGSNWEQQAKLTANDGKANDYFGSSVAVSGDIAIIGTRIDWPAYDDPGSSYVFCRSGTIWTQKSKLVAFDGENGDQFGDQVSVFGDTAIVGAIGDDDKGNSSGSAYIFSLTLDCEVPDDDQYIETGLGHTCFKNSANQVVCWGN